jgi:hypothetical protein
VAIIESAFAIFAIEIAHKPAMIAENEINVREMLPFFSIIPTNREFIEFITKICTTSTHFGLLSRVNFV